MVHWENRIRRYSGREDILDKFELALQSVIPCLRLQLMRTKTASMKTWIVQFKRSLKRILYHCSVGVHELSISEDPGFPAESTMPNVLPDSVPTINCCHCARTSMFHLIPKRSMECSMESSGTERAQSRATEVSNRRDHHWLGKNKRWRGRSNTTPSSTQRNKSHRCRPLGNWKLASDGTNLIDLDSLSTEGVRLVKPSTFWLLGKQWRHTFLGRRPAVMPVKHTLLQHLHQLLWLWSLKRRCPPINFLITNVRYLFITLYQQCK